MKKLGLILCAIAMMGMVFTSCKKDNNDPEPTPTPAGPQVITVTFEIPAFWTETPTAWVWDDGKDGKVAALTQDGNKWCYTTPEAVPALNIIVRNGSDWNGDRNQTVDIRVTKSTNFRLESDGEHKATATKLD